MRAVLMLAAGLWLASTPTHACESLKKDGVAAVDHEMQLLLQQLDNLPESERRLMEQALMSAGRQPQAPAQAGAPAVQQTALLQLLQEMDAQLPEAERRLMEQALQQSADGAVCQAASEEPACKRA